MSLAATQQPAKRALIIGLGRTGVSVARYLSARGYAVAVTDSRSQPPGLEQMQREVPDAAMFLGGFSNAALGHADLVVLSPGVAPSEPFVREAESRGLPVVGDIELFSREAAAPIVAVTGSNGKSTVTTLVGLMAQQAGRNTAVGGNLGTPALDLLDAAVELYVLELSSFQLESTHSLRAAAAAVLNITPDHMDRYASLDAYIGAKQRILEGCATAVLNRDDSRVVQMRHDGRLVSFGLDAPGPDDWGVIAHAGADWLARGDEPVMPVEQLLIRGRHNTANALAALALGEAAGLPRSAILDVLAEFRGLPHRCEFVAEIDGVPYLNDSKATNVGASLAAINGFAQPLVLIAGGDAKGADFSEFATALEGRVRSLVLIGRDAPLIAAAVGERVPVVMAENMDDAVRRAREQAQPGDVVLLSPACASFDMFRNFEQRGLAFATAVRELAA